MRILFYIGTIGKGGAERVIVNIAEGFKQCGHEVLLVNDHKVEIEYKTNIKREILCIKSPNKKSIIRSIVRNTKAIIALRRIYKKKNIEAVISFMPSRNSRAILSGLFSKTKSIFSVRCEPSREPKICHFIYKFSDGAVFQTPQVRDFFCKEIRSKSRVIYNPIGDEFYNYNCKLENRENIVAVARLEKEKNYPGLLRTFCMIHKFYPNDKLIIYGKGTMYEELKQLSEELYISGKVVFAGITDNVAKNIYSAKLFISFSFSEGLSNALMEAMALGIPCIASDVSSGGTRMLFGNNENGLIVPVGDEKVLADTMCRVLDDNNLAERLSSAAKNKSKSFRKDTIVNEWESYVMEIIER